MWDIFESTAAMAFVQILESQNHKTFRETINWASRNHNTCERLNIIAIEREINFTNFNALKGCCYYCYCCGWTEL